MMDEVAKAVGYMALLVGGLVAASYVLRGAPLWFRDVGGWGVLSTALGFGGFAWAGYVLAHRDEFSSLHLLLGLVVLWGGMFVALGLMIRSMDKKKKVPKAGQEPTFRG